MGWTDRHALELCWSWLSPQEINATLKEGIPFSHTLSKLHAAGARCFDAHKLRSSLTAGGACDISRSPMRRLSECIALSNPATGSTSLHGALARLRNATRSSSENGSRSSSEQLRGKPPCASLSGHLHSVRMAPPAQPCEPFTTDRPTGWPAPAQCFLLTIRDPVARLQSAFRWRMDACRLSMQKLNELPESQNRSRHYQSLLRQLPCGQEERLVFFGGICVQSLSE
jgi:hypothetical protein